MGWIMNTNVLRVWGLEHIRMMVGDDEKKGTLHPGLTQMFSNTRLISFRSLQFRHGGLWHSERLVAEGGSVLSALISAESQVRSGSS